MNSTQGLVMSAMPMLVRLHCTALGVSHNQEGHQYVRGAPSCSTIQQSNKTSPLQTLTASLC